MAGFIYLKNVTTLALDKDKCLGCGLCLTVCPQNVLALADKKATIINRDSCMECGACAKNCPVEAITVQVGVGCAQAVINSALGISGPSCCSLLPDPTDPAGQATRGPD